MRPSLYFQCAAMPSSGDAMHFFGANLHFEVAAFRAHHRRVQRLIQIGAGNGDEILDPARNRPPFVVDDAEGGVAVLHRIGDDAQGQKIVHLIHVDLLPLHLLIDRIGALDAAVDARRDAFPPQLGFHRLADLLQKRFAGLAMGFDGFRNLSGRLPDRDGGRPDLPVRRASCPCPGGGRWGRRSRWSRARSVRAAPPAGMWPRVRMLCRRSASLTMITRISLTMASSILRKLSACRSSAEKKSSLLSLVTPSTQRATSSPNSLRTSSTVTLVSSTTSCSRPVSRLTTSMRMSARMWATISGWIMYGSPESRVCNLWCWLAKRKAFSRVAKSSRGRASRALASSSAKSWSTGDGGELTSGDTIQLYRVQEWGRSPTCPLI